METFLIDGKNGAQPPRGRLAVLGLFDGVHLGHRALFERAVLLDRGNVAAITFVGLDKGGELTSASERELLLAECGADSCIHLDFDCVKNMSADSFVDSILVGLLGISSAVVGYNFSFGKGASANAEYLRERLGKYNIPTEIVGEIALGGAPISSSRIRALLRNGELEAAAALLGRDYSISGEIVGGRGLGHTIGVPTVNQRVSDGKLLPRYGVYASVVEAQGRVFRGITNIGMRPTVSGDRVSVETNIFSASGDFYGEYLTVKLKKFLRAERKFDSLDALKRQIERDIAAVEEYFALL